METKAKYALVGSIVIALMVGVVLFVLWLSRAGSETSAQFYIVYFQNQTLDGLQQNSDVTMKGIKVGSIDSFGIAPRNIAQVRVQLRIYEGTPVKVDTKAVIRRNLLTGFARIDLINSSQDSALLTEAVNGEDYPVIPEGQTELGTIADSLPAFVEHFSQLVQRANLFLSEENSKALQQTLVNFASFTDSLASSKTDIQELVKNFSSLSKDLAEISKSGSSFTKKADKNLEQLSNEMTLTLRDIRKAANGFDSRSGEMFESVRNSALIVSSKVGYASQELAESAQTIAATVERFDDPRSLFLGPKGDSLGPGESLPAKQGD